MIERTQGTESSSRVKIQDLQSPVRAELDRVQEELARFFISDVPLINNISHHMMRSNGKRLRPTLLLLVNRLNGPVTKEAVIAATILELVHTATLIHDDSIDRSFLRRGIPTVNSLWNDQTSVIMGDYLYSKAFFLLIEYGMIDVMKVLARTTHRMSLGEMVELEHKLNLDLTEESYYRLILDKTAVLISAACEIGGLLTWGDGDRCRLITDFGTDLGMAFQITDDILDIEGDTDTMGKSSGSDLRDGKVTLPLIHVLRNAPETVTQRIQEIMASEEIDAGAAQEVATLVAEHGGLDYARQRAQVYADRASSLLDEFDESPIRSTLHAAVDYVLTRRM